MELNLRHLSTELIQHVIVVGDNARSLWSSIVWVKDLSLMTCWHFKPNAQKRILVNDDIECAQVKQWSYDSSIILCPILELLKPPLRMTNGCWWRDHTQYQLDVTSLQPNFSQNYHIYTDIGRRCINFYPFQISKVIYCSILLRPIGRELCYSTVLSMHDLRSNDLSIRLMRDKYLAVSQAICIHVLKSNLTSIISLRLQSLVVRFWPRFEHINDLSNGGSSHSSIHLLLIVCCSQQNNSPSW